MESNVADMRRVLAAAANRLENTGQPTILFIDEIHRFNKAQQDVLLPDVESGVVRLIGATTHNPFFFVNSPLVSRSQIFELRPLTEEELFELLQRALADAERGLGHLKIQRRRRRAAPSGQNCRRRRAQGAELAGNRRAHHRAGRRTGSFTSRWPSPSKASRRRPWFMTATGTRITTRFPPSSNPCAAATPDAALYWLAKMIHAGEDPRFIARRIVICAAEDVGLADPMALVLANAALQAAEFVGWPEARIPLAEATIYIATAQQEQQRVSGD